MHTDERNPLILALGEAVPDIDDTAFIAPGSAITGDVRVGADASVWYGASLRGDYVPVSIGARSNVQDNATLHADPGFPCDVQEDVTIGHNAVVHGCTVEPGCVIGMSAVIMNGAVIGAGSLVAGGAVVMPGTKVPPGSLVAGMPAKVRRPTSDTEREQFLRSAATYVENAKRHKAALDDA
ncbi:MAG TPA: gamma carbonic anhydrase family protein [Propionibacterium sp.]|jgi:carbonic anhydrase/acetyltransferase-like protein (isoleucine patch superfamily)|nr:gamma carbonic anhydrase family protein [Propionibacterium sp.]